MSVKLFAEIFREMRRQELDELVSDSALIGRRTLDPEYLYPSSRYNMQLRQNHEFAPQLAKRGQTVTINDLYRACQEVASRNMMSMEVVRFLDKDTGVIFQGTITIGNFAGQGIPSISAVTSAMEVELRKITPRFVLELLDQGDIYLAGPQSLRRRGWWRLMSTSGDGRGIKP